MARRNSLLRDINKARSLLENIFELLEKDFEPFGLKATAQNKHNTILAVSGRMTVGQ